MTAKTVNLATTPELEDKAEAIAKPEEELSIAKPRAFSLDKFKSKSGAAMANVGTLVRRCRSCASLRPKTSLGCTMTRRLTGRTSSAS